MNDSEVANFWQVLRDCETGMSVRKAVKFSATWVDSISAAWVDSISAAWVDSISAAHFLP